MELFHELRNAYFLHTLFLISSMENGTKITKQEVYDSFREVFNENGTLIPDYVDDIVNLLFEEKNQLLQLKPEIESVPIRLLNFEKEWLCHVLKDQRSSLFISDDLRSKLNSKLDDTADFINNAIEIRGLYNGADDVTKPAYINTFKTVLEAIQENKILSFRNKSFNNNEMADKKQKAVPYAIEYSILEGIFRVSLYSLDSNRPIKVNLSRLSDVSTKGASPKTRDEIRAAIEEKRVKEPLTLRINDDRKNNAVERCFALFSTYEKTGHFIKDGLYELVVLYYVFEEMEIIQKVLMLGPDIEILGNDEIKSKILDLLERQKQLLV